MNTNDTSSGAQKLQDPARVAEVLDQVAAGEAPAVDTPAGRKNVWFSTTPHFYLKASGVLHLFRNGRVPKITLMPDEVLALANLFERAHFAGLADRAGDAPLQWSEDTATWTIGEQRRNSPRLPAREDEHGDD